MSEPLATDDVTDIFAQLAARSRLAAELRPANKAALFSLLSAAGVSRIAVMFDGGGDEGQIESVEAFAGEDACPLPVEELEIASADWNGVGVVRQTLSVAEAVEALAYDALEELHAGWENDDGAFGEFSFDVAGGSITLEYNERNTVYDSHQHQL